MSFKIQKGNEANFGPKHSTFVFCIGPFINHKKIDFFLARFSRIGFCKFFFHSILVLSHCLWSLKLPIDSAPSLSLPIFWRLPKYCELNRTDTWTFQNTLKRFGLNIWAFYRKVHKQMAFKLFLVRISKIFRFSKLLYIFKLF